MSRFSNRGNRRLPTTAAIVASFALFCGSEAAAYGPMTHMGEAERAVEWLASGQGGPSVPPQLVALVSLVATRPELRLHLYLGAVLPDMREAAPSIAFATHSRPFAEHMLFNVACDDQRDLLHRAIALGYAAHVCSDIAAQVFAVPFFAAGGGAGASDVLIALSDDRPDGENELWVEGILDIYFGNVNTLLEMYDYFQPDPPAPERVDNAVDFWLSEASAFFGPGQIGDATAIRQEIHETLQSVAEELTPQRRDQLLGAMDLLREYNLGDVIIMVEGLGLLDELVTLGYEAELDRAELRSLQEVSPFFGDEHHFDDYPVWLNDLGPTILIETAAGAPWLDNWPVWQAEPLAASTIQSLSGVAGPEFGARTDVTVYDLWWEDPDTSDVITTVDSTTLPSRVRLVVEVFPVAPTDNPILARIRKGLPAAEYLAGGVVAETRVETGWSPFDLNGDPPFRLELEADLNISTLAYAEGLHAELATPADTDGSAMVFFTTSWEAFENINSLDLTRPVYPLNFSTYDYWPGSVRVRPVIGDDTPPSAPLVDFNPERLTRREPVLHVSVQAVDNESSVREYLLRIGTTPGGSDILNATRVPATGSDRTGRFDFVVADELIQSGGELHITAVAVNHADLESPEGRGGPVILEPEKGSGCGCRSLSTLNGEEPPMAVFVLLILIGLCRRLKTRERKPWRD